MDEDKVDYVFNYYGGLMTDNEYKAWRHYSSNYKLTHGGEKEPKLEKKKMYLKNGWLSTDPDVLSLLDNGIDEFKRNTVLRILNESSNEVTFNLCSNCQKLARTPRAKQCRFCRYDWH